VESKEIVERLVKTEERTKSNTHRLDKLESLVNEIHTMTNTMVQLVEEVKHINETVRSLDDRMEQMDGRIDVMEHEPLNDLNMYKRTAITAIISTVAGALATGIVVVISNFV